MTFPREAARCRRVLSLATWYAVLVAANPGFLASVRYRSRSADVFGKTADRVEGVMGDVAEKRRGVASHERQEGARIFKFTLDNILLIVAPCRSEQPQAGQRFHCLCCFPSRSAKAPSRENSRSSNFSTHVVLIGPLSPLHDCGSFRDPRALERLRIRQGRVWNFSLHSGFDVLRTSKRGGYFRVLLSLELEAMPKSFVRSEPSDKVSLLSCRNQKKIREEKFTEKLRLYGDEFAKGRQAFTQL